MHMVKSELIFFFFNFIVTMQDEWFKYWMFQLETNNRYFLKKKKKKKETNSIYHSSYKSTTVFMHELNLLKKISDKLGLRFSMVLFSIFISSCKNSCIFLHKNFFFFFNTTNFNKHSYLIIYFTLYFVKILFFINFILFSQIIPLWFNE